MGPFREMVQTDKTQVCDDYVLKNQTGIVHI